LARGGPFPSCAGLRPWQPPIRRQAVSFATRVSTMIGARESLRRSRARRALEAWPRVVARRRARFVLRTPRERSRLRFQSPWSLLESHVERNRRRLNLKRTSSSAGFGLPLVDLSRRRTLANRRDRRLYAPRGRYFGQRGALPGNMFLSQRDIWATSRRSYYGIETVDRGGSANQDPEDQLTAKGPMPEPSGSLCEARNLGADCGGMGY